MGSNERTARFVLEVPSGPFLLNMAKKKFDVEKHVLVPEHAKLSDKEKDALLSRLKIDLYDLPQIKKKDPAAKALGVKMGDVIKITRKSPTAGTSTFYRVVVHA